MKSSCYADGNSFFFLIIYILRGAMPTFIQEDCLTMEEIPVEGYEKVYKVEDSSVGLKAIICLHDLTLGPGLGGTRIYPYATFEAALTDAKRLAKGMTYKSAVSGCALGGAKAVIIADPVTNKTPELLKSYARAVDRLEGAFITAEDSGCSTKDVAIIGGVTKYVLGLLHEKSSGNPSYYTAWGVYRGIQASLKKIYGTESVKGRTVAIQGVGSVGYILAAFLFWNGAKLILSDIDEAKCHKIATQFGATQVSPEEILSVSCDVLSPCGLGGIINSKTIPNLRCKAIAGAANNQLWMDSDGDLLLQKGILYAPDFVINSGGLINVEAELHPEDYDPVAARDKVDLLYDQLLLIFNSAEETGLSTHQTAVNMGDDRIRNKIGVRTIPVCFHRIP